MDIWDTEWKFTVLRSVSPTCDEKLPFIQQTVSVEPISLPQTIAHRAKAIVDYKPGVGSRAGMLPLGKDDQVEVKSAEDNGFYRAILVRKSKKKLEGAERREGLVHLAYVAFEVKHPIRNATGIDHEIVPRFEPETGKSVKRQSVRVKKVGHSLWDWLIPRDPDWDRTATKARTATFVPSKSREFTQPGELPLIQGKAVKVHRYMKNNLFAEGLDEDGDVKLFPLHNMGEYKEPDVVELTELIIKWTNDETILDAFKRARRENEWCEGPHPEIVLNTMSQPKKTPCNPNKKVIHSICRCRKA